MKYLDNTRTLTHKGLVINLRTEVGITPDSANNEQLFYVVTRIIGLNLDGKWFNPNGIGEVSKASLADIEDLNATFKKHEEAIKGYAEDIIARVSNTRKLVKTLFDAYLTESEGHL